MNCTYCEDRLSDYLENTLETRERALVEMHLQSCSACTELLNGVRNLMYWGRELPAQIPPLWLSSRIVANTPQVVRITWRDWASTVWRNVSEPRFALSLLTSTIMLGWMGSMAGITMEDVAMVRHPSEIYYRMEGAANRLYGEAVRSISSSPLLNAIQCQLHSRIEQFRENS